MDSEMDELRQLAHQKLIERGEKERLKELLKARLQKAGFYDAILEKCKEYVRIKGIESVSIDDIIAHVSIEARKSVPDDVRSELLSNIKKFVADEISPNCDDRA